MEIVTQQLGDALEVKVTGRLDNYWTEHLRGNLEEIIRGGAHGVRLNASEITFLSSAGVGLLVKLHTQLKGIGGSFLVTSPSPRVKQVLDLCQLSPILIAQTATPAPAAVHKSEDRRFSSLAGSFEVIECASAKPLICERIGDPGLLKGCRFGPGDSRMVAYPETTFGFGLGAFGNGFEDARTRFGEFLAVGGSAAYLPTDGTNVPDFMVSSGELVPEMNVLYGLRWEGGFTHLMRFETSNAEGPIALAELVRTALEISGAPAIGMVMVVESAGLVGAALRRSPAASRRSQRRIRSNIPRFAPGCRSPRTTVLAIAGPDLRRSGEFRVFAAGFTAPAAGSGSVACRDIFMQPHFPIVRCKREYRSEKHGHNIVRDRDTAGRTSPFN